jgi:fatty-acyl-CoA synthase
MFYLVRTLIRIKLLTFKSLYYFLESLLIDGFNMLALLRYVYKTYSGSVALNVEDKEFTYQQLYDECHHIAYVLQNEFALQKNKHVAVLCKNHQTCVQSIIALSALGVDIYLLNAEMSTLQLTKIVQQHTFDLIIYDAEKENDLHWSGITQKVSVTSLIKLSGKHSIENEYFVSKKIKGINAGKVVVLTGGSSGNYKTAVRNPSILNFSHPLAELLTKLKIYAYRSVYIATPVYHGYGFSALITSLVLGKKIFLREKISTDKVASLIQKHEIEVLILVPVILQRLMDADPAVFKQVQCILSGGAPIDRLLVMKTIATTGNKLFNLYGSSEAGFSVLATPEDLQQHPDSIGKPIHGVEVKIINNGQEVSDHETGMIFIRCNWTADNHTQQWVETGDMGFKNQQGYIFLKGRKDNMIVSGGENVYPEEVESVLYQHQQILQASVIGIPDELYGQRLKVFAVKKDSSDLSEEVLMDWLRNKVARYQMPAGIVFVESIPMLETGKVNTQELLKYQSL